MQDDELKQCRKVICCTADKEAAVHVFHFIRRIAGSTSKVSKDSQPIHGDDGSLGLRILEERWCTIRIQLMLCHKGRMLTILCGLIYFASHRNGHTHNTIIPSSIRALK